MSESYNTFAARAFGPVLAEQAQEEGQTRITVDLRRRAARAWNLTPAAFAAVLREAQRRMVLSAEQSSGEASAR